jgi:Family of unknown function (DUF5686)/CarboxypepD_reg-like domain
MYKVLCLLFNLLLVAILPISAQVVAGRVFDSHSKQPVPFATIRFGTTPSGMVAGLDGEFTFDASAYPGVDSITVTCLGYLPSTQPIRGRVMEVALMPAEATVGEVVFTPPYEKIRRILHTAIAQKGRNNPDKYNAYRCNMYYKMTADAAKKGDGGVPDKMRNLAPGDGHLLLSETYSVRHWRRPQQLQEDVVASRFSGLQRSTFMGLVTDVLPFHAYSDYLKLNGKDYHNPVSRGCTEQYTFNLSDEVVQGADTLWVLSFTPKRDPNGLRGRVTISSNGYAISSLVAHAKDTMLKLNVGIEQEYARLPDGADAKWFPKQLNYKIDWLQQINGKEVALSMTGYAQTDSVTFDAEPEFAFDKAHTVRQDRRMGDAADSVLGRVRPKALDTLETTTYRLIDSLGQKQHLDDVMYLLSESPQWKMPIGYVDVDLKRVFSYNQFEGVRLGLGLQTGDAVSKHMSIGGYACYGLTDAHWKFGAFTDCYFDRFKEHSATFAYSNDVRDPGRLHINPDLDKNYLNSYLLWRVDRVRELQCSTSHKLGYWTATLAATRDWVMPQYRYGWMNGGREYSSYNVAEAGVQLRYAFGEHTAPFFNRYYPVSSQYPIAYAKLAAGNIDSGALRLPYVQAAAALLWHKHINRVGFEHLLVSAAKSWSASPLPLGRLFAANGYNYNGSNADPSVYTFGGMMTISPYGLYTDRFVSLIYRHDFDKKLFRYAVANLNFAPYACLQYDMIWGGLSHPEAQQGVAFEVPTSSLSEGGILLKDLLRVKYLNLYYLCVDFGCFQQLSTAVTGNAPRLVFGASLDL